MFCPKCGAKNADGAKFCGACGHAFPSAGEAGAVRQAAAKGSETKGARQLSDAPELLERKEARRAAAARWKRRAVVLAALVAADIALIALLWALDAPHAVLGPIVPQPVYDLLFW